MSRTRSVNSHLACRIDRTSDCRNDDGDEERSLVLLTAAADVRLQFLCGMEEREGKGGLLLVRDADGAILYNARRDG